MDVILYGIPNCDQVKKARTWLNEQQITHHFHDFKKAGITPELIQSWLTQFDWQTLINRKGTTWRKLSEHEQTSIQNNETAISCMMQHPSVIKRPILAFQDQQHTHMLAGFSEQNYQRVFKL
jgi:arsenate reductase